MLSLLRMLSLWCCWTRSGDDAESAITADDAEDGAEDAAVAAEDATAADECAGIVDAADIANYVDVDVDTDPS